MPRYSWNNSELIDAVEVKENLRYRYALVHLKEGISQADMLKLPGMFQAHGMVAFMDANADKPILRVRDFGKVSHLLSELQHAGLVEGGPTSKEPLEEELNPEVISRRKLLKQYTIPAAGAVYLIADMMPIASGVARKTPSEVLQGSLFALTSLALVLFGRKNPEVQVGNMYTKMKQFMAQEGVPMDEDPKLALQQLERDPSYWNKLVNFLYEHPVLFNNTIQGFGCYNGHRAGVAQGNPWKNAAGLSGTIGQWGGMIIPEDKYAGLDPEAKAERLRLRAEGEEPENGFNTRFLDNPIAWIREKPLRFTAIGTITQNFLVGGSSTFHDRHNVNEYFGFKSKKYELNPARIIKDIHRNRSELYNAAGVSREALRADRAKPEWLRQHAELDKMISTHIGNRFTALSPFFNIIANTLYGMSSKEERSENLDAKGYLDEVIGMAASVYAHVPEAERSEKIIRFAGFLRSQPDVEISEKVIRERVVAQIAALEKAGWIAEPTANENHAPTPRTQVDAAAAHQQLLAPTANESRAAGG